LILDEPSDGLDPIGVEQMLESLVAQCGEGTTVFFSSHQIAEVERVADHVCMIHQGRIVIDDALDDMRQSYRRIDLVFATPPEETELRLAGVEAIRMRGRQMSVFVSRNADAVTARAHELHASSVEVTTVGLREIFLETAQERLT
jgi:ABC-2 type transport system ATP-binding protein